MFLYISTTLSKKCDKNMLCYRRFCNDLYHFDFVFNFR